MNQKKQEEQFPGRKGPKQTLLLSAGLILVGLAALGALLPILPTTPFLLAAAACFSVAKPEWVDRIEKNRIFGPYIEAYRKNMGISPGRKAFALACLWTVLILTVLYVKKIWLTVVLSAIGIGVTMHLLLFKTRR